MHERQFKIKVGQRKSRRFQDDLVMLKDKTFVKLTAGNGPWTGRKVLTTPYNPPIGIPLPWNIVGMAEYRGIDETEICNVARADIAAKAVIFDGVISSWMTEWNLSKRDE